MLECSKTRRTHGALDAWLKGGKMRAIRALGIAGLLVALIITGGVAIARAAGPALHPGVQPARPGIACIIRCVTYDWNFVQSGNQPTADNRLYAVASVSANDKWAVGLGNNASPYQTLIEHFTGRTWNIVPSPNVVGVGNALYAVTAITANDAWAGGFYEGPPSGQITGHPLFEHWNGSTWSIVPSPAPPADSGAINGFYAISSTNVWAVGALFTETAVAAHSPLVEHWDGTAWSIVAAPIPVSNGHNDDTSLQGVSGTSASDVWAVGYHSDPLIPTGGHVQTLFEHWDGVGWSILTGANPSTDLNQLFGVSAVTSNDVWAAGTYSDSQTGATTLLEHWNGMGWSAVPAPGTCSVHTCSVLYGISARSSSDIWAVGSATVNLTYSVPMVVHWNGSSWSLATIQPYPGCDRGYHFQGVVASSATDASAVGWCDIPSHFTTTLAARYGPSPVSVKGSAPR